MHIRKSEKTFLKNTCRVKNKTNKICLWSTNAPATAIFSKTVTLITDLNLDRWPWLWYLRKFLSQGIYMWNMKVLSLTFKIYGRFKSFLRTNKRTGQKLYAPDLLLFYWFSAKMASILQAFVASNFSYSHNVLYPIGQVYINLKGI